MRTRFLAYALPLLILIGPGAADARAPTTVASWLATLDRVQGGHEMSYAWVQKYLRAVYNAMYDGGAEARRLNTLSIGAGKGPLYCSPTGKGEVRLQMNELRDFFRALPPEKQQMAVKDVFILFAEHKHPCPGKAAGSGTPAGQP
ncbi:MAG: hypothetical protein E6G94_12205 [Alphaproteobacteria bacterium]|nr:MAG: hypothetical protein E6G94_12205 [Alphaproteobacteria bacterium]